MRNKSKNEQLILVTICLIALVFLGLLTKFYSECESKNGIMTRDTFGIYHCLQKEKK